MHLPARNRTAATSGRRISVLSALMGFVSLIAMTLSTQVHAGTQTCFDNPDNYADPHIYLWEADVAITTQGWPGFQMQQVGSHYCYEFGADVGRVNVVFNDNGSPKTSDLTYQDGQGCFTSGQWVSLTECGLGDPIEISAANICFDNPDNYQNPRIHFWNTTPTISEESVWPGREMIQRGAHYCYEMPQVMDSMGVVFNNNGNEKSPDLNYSTPNACWDAGSWKTLEACGFIVSNGNQSPVANAGSDITINAGESVTLDGSLSSDPDGEIVDFHWGNNLRGISVTRVFSEAGVHPVTLTVTDNGGLEASDTLMVTVLAAPQEITSTNICFDNPDNYANPTIHNWNASPAGVVNDSAWPGNGMIERGDYYCYDYQVAIDSMGIVFNNSDNPKTDDLTYQTPNNCWSNGQWQTLEDCGFIVTGQPNQRPIANAGSDISIELGQSVTFDGFASSDADGTVEEYRWSNGRDTATWSQVFPEVGSFDFTLTVVDNEGLESFADTITVTVSAPFTFPEGKALYFHNANNWPTPTAYLWNVLPDGSVADQPWPGDAMTESGSDFWFIDIPQVSTSGMIIFSNNGNDKTVDLPWDETAPCYRDGNWMSLEACGIPEQSLADAGPDRTVNVNTQLALSAAASSSDIAGAEWTSGAWSGTLVGASVVTPALDTLGTFTVTMTLADGGTDSFELTVVEASRGFAERPLLSAPLNFPVSGDVDPSNYVFERAFPNIDDRFVSPVMVTHDGFNSDLIYVVDKPGQLYVFPNRENVTDGEVTALLDVDFHTGVRDAHEQGLLSVAFHPNFSTNRLVYLYYIEYTGNDSFENQNYNLQESEGINGNNDRRATDWEDGVLVRFRLNDAINPTGVEPGSLVEVLRIPSTNPDHKGGQMAFHPLTGEFFMSIGEMGYGESATDNPTRELGRVNNNAQDVTTLAGSFIRVNMLEGDEVDLITGTYYSIPSDNPFSDVFDGTRREIWSWGHRNPWRWAFDTVPDNSELPENAYTIWEAEIGQDGDDFVFDGDGNPVIVPRYEEVNIIRKGQNYGWPICEGTAHRGAYGGDPSQSRQCTNDLAGPENGYLGNEGKSIIGGFVYRGNKFSAIQGKFLFGDYVERTIWTVEKGQEKQIFSASFPGFVSSFGTDFSGEEIYVSTHGVQFGTGSSIYRVEIRDPANGTATIPTKLSETGIFADVANRIPSHGVIEYAVNSHAWFDGAEARRFVAVPNDQTIDVSNDYLWDLPVGSVLIKHLDLPTSDSTSEPFETSVLFKQESGRWVAANYGWDEDGLDATLVSRVSNPQKTQWLNGQSITVNRTLRPGTSCDGCHTGEGTTPPRDFETRQLNRAFDYHGVSDNQTNLFSAIGLLSGPTSNDAFVDPSNVSEDLNQRALTYLDTNCSGCHDGGLDGAAMDYRFDIPLSDRNVMNNANRLVPFDHGSSEVYIRQTSSTLRMPEGSALTNPLAESLIREWLTGDAVWAEGPISTDVILDAPADIVSGVELGLTAVATYSNEFESIPSSGVQWQSGNDLIVSIANNDTARNTATAQRSGTTTVTAMANGWTASVDIIVESGVIPPSNFVAVAQGSDAIQLTWDDNTANESEFILRRTSAGGSGFEQIASLDPNTVQYLDEGLEEQTEYIYELVAVTIEGESNPVNATATTRPGTGNLASIRIVPGQLVLENSQQLVVVGTRTDELEVGLTQDVTWRITSGSNVVSISDAGVVTRSAAGEATIEADFGAFTATLDIVESVPVEVRYDNPENWTNVFIYLWTVENGQNVEVNPWPGVQMANPTEATNQLWSHSFDSTHLHEGSINVIFNDGGSAQTDNLENVVPSAQYVDGMWTSLDITPRLSVVAGTTQTGERDFPSGTVVRINADEAPFGTVFSGWTGVALPYIIGDDTSSSIDIVMPNKNLSIQALFNTGTRPDLYREGREFYAQLGCGNACHGDIGQGGTSFQLNNLHETNKYTFERIVEIINDDMPWQGDTSACTGSNPGDCAYEIARMIMGDGWLDPNACNEDCVQALDSRNIRLLTRIEYLNSVRDIFGIQFGEAIMNPVPVDASFKNFTTSSFLVSDWDKTFGYELVAQEIADQVVSRSGFSGVEPSCGTNARCVVQTLGRKLFRRSLATPEIDSYSALFDNEDSGRTLVQALLMSPNFLYRSELGETAGDGVYQLTNYEIATLLSYTFWVTTPDEQLLSAAESSNFDIRAQAQRLINDPRALVGLRRFASDWLIDKRSAFPGISSETLGAAFNEETIHFITESIRTNLPFNELLTANYSYVNAELAQHYGMEPVTGSGWERREYPEGNRLGVMSHGSFLASRTRTQNPSPIRRGVFVRDILLCQEFPTPAAANFEITFEDSDTNRQATERHTSDPSCSACHQYIDGVGFGFESFGSDGLFRTTETVRDGSIVPVVSDGAINSLFAPETLLQPGEGQPYSTIPELATLMSNSPLPNACFSRQFYRYVTGREEHGQIDERNIREYSSDLRNGGGMLDMLIDITTHDSFILRSEAN